MDITYVLIGALFFIMIIGLLDDSRHKEQIKRMQNQIDELCKVTGHGELVSSYLSDEEKKQILNLKNNGKNVEGIKKIREFTGLELKEAKELFECISQG